MPLTQQKLAELYERVKADPGAVTGALSPREDANNAGKHARNMRNIAETCRRAATEIPRTSDPCTRACEQLIVEAVLETKTRCCEGLRTPQQPVGDVRACVQGVAM